MRIYFQLLKCQTIVFRSLVSAWVMFFPTSSGLRTHITPGLEKSSVKTCKVIAIWERKKEAKTLAAPRIHEYPSGSIRRHEVLHLKLGSSFWYNYHSRGMGNEPLRLKGTSFVFRAQGGSCPCSPSNKLQGKTHCCDSWVSWTLQLSVVGDTRAILSWQVPCLPRLKESWNILNWKGPKRVIESNLIQTIKYFATSCKINYFCMSDRSFPWPRKSFGIFQNQGQNLSYQRTVLHPQSNPLK